MSTAREHLRLLEPDEEVVEPGAEHLLAERAEPDPSAPAALRAFAVGMAAPLFGPVRWALGPLTRSSRRRCPTGRCQTPPVEFSEVARAVDGIPFMSPEYGRRIYDHIRATRPEQALELGSAHGVGSAYIAAALAANGNGHLTTVDYSLAAYAPAPEDTLGRLGLTPWVTIERGHSTYNWSLKERIAAQSDEQGNCTPVYDFVYLDGSKNWNFDGLAVLLVEKLLRDDGWLVMDDLGWVYGENPWAIPEPDPRAFGPFSATERDEPHLRAVFELLVMQHPSFSEFRLEDEWFGWARKRPGAARSLEITTSRSLLSMATAEVRKAVRRRRRARGGGRG